MHLDDEERAMLAGEFGEPRRMALDLQIRIGRVFDAPDFVEVSQAHVMGDTESLGEAGVEFLESLANHDEAERRVRVPTITDPRGIDFCAYRRLGQKDEWAALEQRAIDAMRALGILMTDTCISYQTVSPPVFGEHAAFGDTGVVIYSNSVCGARSNFEGGPAAISAGLTGRTPRYGCHLDRHRRGTHLFEVGARPKTLNDWGALGAIVGRAVNSYWHVPVIDGIDGAPTSDELKHFGAALASYGSVPMFHMTGNHAGSPRQGQRLRRAAGADSAYWTDRSRRLPSIVRPSRRRCRRGGLRGPPAFSGRAAATRRSAARQTYPSGYRDADRDLAGEQGRLRSHGLHGDLRGGRRPPPPGRLLLPDAGAGDWAKPTAGGACSPTPPSSSTSFRVTDTIRSSPPWRHAWTRRCRDDTDGCGRSLPAGSSAATPASARKYRGWCWPPATTSAPATIWIESGGVFSRPVHALYGESYVGRILVLNTAKGGVATAWMLREMRSRGMAPAALLLNRANPIMVQGAAFAGLPFIDRFEVDITRTLRTGDTVTVFPDEGLVRVDSGEGDTRGTGG